MMGDVGLEPEDGEGYEAYLEGRVLELGRKAGRQELNEEWKRIRRGWYLGGDGFRGRLMKRVKETMAHGKSTSYLGSAKQTHGLVEAQRLLAEGLKALGLKAGMLEEEPKGMPEKQVLAWWLRQQKTVRRPRDERAVMDGGTSPGCRRRSAW